jgi:hypothetical protein
MTELNWVEYQIRHGIEMICIFNSIVWMSLNWNLELYGLIRYREVRLFIERDGF